MTKLLKIMLTVTAIWISSCELPISNETGSMTLSVSQSTSRTLLPTINMNPASYNLTGLGPDGTTFTLNLATGTSTTKNALKPGSWTVTATALNADGIAIGEGSVVTEVLSGQSTNALITVKPFTGFGTLQISASWPVANVATPEIKATLTSSSGVIRNLDFPINGPAGTANFSASDVSTGYHTLSLILNDNGVLRTGSVEVVRIVAGQTTSGSYSFNVAALAGGNINIDITPEMADPLTVNILGAMPQKPLGQVLSLTGSVENFTAGVVYTWYVNGSAQGIGPTFEVGASWPVGTYRIDMTAYASDGSRAGSATTSIEVTQGTPVPQSLAIIGDATGNGWQNDKFTLTKDSKGRHVAITYLVPGWFCLRAPGGWTISGVSTTSPIVPDAVITKYTLGNGSIQVTDPGFYFIRADLTDGTFEYGKVSSVGVIGSGTPGYWNADTDLNGNTATDEFSLNMNLIDGLLKFRLNHTWSYTFGDGPEAPNPDIFDGVLSQDASNIPTSAGNYTVKFNGRNFAYTITSQVVSNDLAIVGDATGLNWDTDKFVLSRDHQGRYVAITYLVPGWFSLRAPGTWAGGGFGTSSSVTATSTITSYTLGNVSPQIVTAGFYFIRVDKIAGTFELGQVTSVGVIGSATPGVWSSDTDLLGSSTTDTFSLNTPLVTGVLKFRLNHTWDFTFGDGPSGNNTEPFDGVLSQNAFDIPVTAGLDTVTFNGRTFGYTIF